jgi:cyclophilin family peptidyl-prolyl cis-trans isomerase
MTRMPLVILAFAALAVAGCGDDDSGSASTTTTAQKPKLACKDVKHSAVREAGGQKKPTDKLPADVTYQVEMSTSCGDFTIQLDQKAAPRTVASFVSLARNGFYDDTVFHRIVPNFVVQGGDPTGSGTGDPGYTVRDTPAGDTTYTQGVVAMGKEDSQAPGTAGSQFFIVTAPDAGLPPEYAPLGKIVKGLPVVQLIGAQGDPGSGSTGTPKRVVLLKKATVSEQ